MLKNSMQDMLMENLRFLSGFIRSCAQFQDERNRVAFYKPKNKK